MARPTLTSIHDKLEVIHKDVQELKQGKVDKDTNELVIKQIDDKIKDVQSDVRNINAYGKWLILLIGGALLTAIIRLVIK
ncbi:MAG TPA: hypothetical protein PKC05_02680 [Candidatus Saccharibacteria bacterium]|nr:hypothetical protein [Candidatus Saccharibacteria bacterium]